MVLYLSMRFLIFVNVPPEVLPTAPSLTLKRVAEHTRPPLPAFYFANNNDTATQKKVVEKEFQRRTGTKKMMKENSSREKDEWNCRGPNLKHCPTDKNTKSGPRIGVSLRKTFEIEEVRFWLLLLLQDVRHWSRDSRMISKGLILRK